MQPDEVQCDGHVDVVEAGFGQAAVAGAAGAVAGGLVHGAFDAGAAGVAGLEREGVLGGAAGGQGFGEFAGLDGELPACAAGAQGAGRARAAVVRGEPDDDDGLAAVDGLIPVDGGVSLRQVTFCWS